MGTSQRELCPKTRGHTLGLNGPSCTLEDMKIICKHNHLVLSLLFKFGRLFQSIPGLLTTPRFTRKGGNGKVSVAAGRALENCASVLQANWKLFPGTPRSMPFDMWIMFLTILKKSLLTPTFCAFLMLSCFRFSHTPACHREKKKKPTKMQQREVSPKSRRLKSTPAYSGQRAASSDSLVHCWAHPTTLANEGHLGVCPVLAESTPSKHMGKYNLHLLLTHSPNELWVLPTCEGWDRGGVGGSQHKYAGTIGF